MERWTIAESHEGRFRMHINHGGKPFWCMFDFAVCPTLESDGVEIRVVDDADQDTMEWFSHLRTGIVRGLETATAKGREWKGVLVEIRKIHAHPIATTADACEWYGFSFALHELPRHGIQRT